MAINFINKKSDFNAKIITSPTNTYNTIAKNIISLPTIDLYDMTRATNTFSGCTKLVDVSFKNPTRLTQMNGMFTDCHNLSDTSLNNILKMCIEATAYEGTKTLYYLGFRANKYSQERIESLSNYQDFVNAGWTTGYES